MVLLKIKILVSILNFITCQLGAAAGKKFNVSESQLNTCTCSPPNIAQIWFSSVLRKRKINISNAWLPAPHCPSLPTFPNTN